MLLPPLLLLVLAASSAWGGSVSGTVVDGLATPLPGARVRLSGATGGETVTDAAGSFAFRGLPGGSYRLAVQSGAGVVLPEAERAIALGQDATVTLSFAVVAAPATAIPAIQGRAHLSPLDRQSVSGVPGIVTAVRPGLGFYLQNPQPDSDDGTSEGILVTGSRLPTIHPGDLVLVDGRVQEYYGGGRDAGDLSVTRIRADRVTTLLTGLDLPAPVILGESGRIPPDRVVCDDASGNAEDSRFDPEHDGIDFYESLEGMLVQVDGALVVGSVHTSYGEFQVVGDGGRHASTVTRRGALILAEGDQNPERITVDLRGEPDILRQSISDLTVGDRFAGPISGPLDYSYSDYKILPTAALPPLVAARLPREEAPDVRGPRTLTVATLNVENLSPRSPAEKLRDIAVTVVGALHSPDIVALEEIQDDSGPSDDGTVSAEGTLRLLTEAIKAAGGPSSYAWRQISPRDNQDGGEPGANIRVVLLYDRERIRFVERPADPDAPLSVRSEDGHAALSASPGLIAAGSRAMAHSRKPLACEVEFDGRRIFVVVVHLTSRSGDAQVFARSHPLPAGSEETRLEQAGLIRKTVESILTIDARAPVIVLGDFNEYAYASPLVELKAGGLMDLAERLLPPEERYSYVYRGNAQDLDHILVSPALLEASARIWIPHRYAEYLYGFRQTDHDPLLAAFVLDNAER